MSLHKIIVLILALVMFGGVAYLVWNNKKQSQGSTQPPDDKPSRQKQ
jgi:hypothetical protein